MPAPDRATELIVLFGIPGTGKTWYGEHLQERHGYHHIESDRQERGLSQNAILEILPAPWGSGPTPVGYVAALCDRHGGRVVLEWGFLVNFLPYLLQLRSQGARLVWFQADTARARVSFAEAKRNSPNAMVGFSLQCEAIQKAGLPTKEFQTIEVWKGERRRSYAEIDELVRPLGSC